MDAQRFRELANRCREPARVAEKDDIREQLRQWTIEFEAEAKAAEKPSRFTTRAGECSQASFDTGRLQNRRGG